MIKLNTTLNWGVIPRGKGDFGLGGLKGDLKRENRGEGEL